MSHRGALKIMPGRSGAHALKRDAEEAGMGSSPRSAPELKRTVSTDAFEAFVDSPRRPPPPPSLVKALLPAPLSTSPPKRRVFWARSGECPPDLGMMRMLNVEARSRHRVDGNPPVGHYATASTRVKRGAAPTSTGKTAFCEAVERNHGCCLACGYSMGGPGECKASVKSEDAYCKSLEAPAQRGCCAVCGQAWSDAERRCVLVSR